MSDEKKLPWVNVKKIVRAEFYRGYQVEIFISGFAMGDKTSEELQARARWLEDEIVKLLRREPE